MDNGQPIDERHLEVARQLGEHGARIDGLERRLDNDVREIRSTLARLEAQRVLQPPALPAPQADPNLLLAVQGMNRMVDALAKSPPPPTTTVQLPQNVSPFNPVAVLGYVIGSLALAWAARGFFPGV